MSTARSRRMSCDMFTLPSARLKDLSVLLDFTDAFCIDSGIEDEDRFALKIAIEEVSANIMLHGYGPHRPGPIELSLCAGEDTITVKIIDRAQPFDPIQAPEPDLDATWEERKIGGLGWHLVRELMDTVAYHYDPAHGNVVDLVRRRSRS
jgi:serine/threonine-protein kinase RsbW